MKKFFTFQTMLFPICVQLIYGLQLLLCIVLAIAQFMHHAWGHGFIILIIVPIVLRIACEMGIVLFRIHACLENIQNKLGADSLP